MKKVFWIILAVLALAKIGTMLFLPQTNGSPKARKSYASAPIRSTVRYTDF